MKDRPGAHYSVRHFLEDEVRLLTDAGPGPEAVPDCIEEPDGRLLPLPTLPLREAIETRATDSFSTKYGPELGADHLERFRQVLEFIATYQAEMRAAGVASSGDPTAVREEFLDYLLNWSARTDSGRIPVTALGRFLDEWGTRWI